MGDFVPGVCPGGNLSLGFCPRGDFVLGGILSGGDFVRSVCPWGFCPRTFYLRL